MAAHNGHVRSKPVAVTLLLAEPAAVVTDTEAEAAAKLFKALSDPVRIRLVSLIRHSPGGEACFCDLAEDFNMPQPSLSHHLRVLVTARRPHAGAPRHVELVQPRARAARAARIPASRRRPARGPAGANNGH